MTREPSATALRLTGQAAQPGLGSDGRAYFVRPPAAYAHVRRAPTFADVTGSSHPRGVGVYSQTATDLGYAWEDVNLSLGPSLAVYTMPACKPGACRRVEGVSPGIPGRHRAVDRLRPAGGELAGRRRDRAGRAHLRTVGTGRKLRRPMPGLWRGLLPRCRKPDHQAPKPVVEVLQLQPGEMLVYRSHGAKERMQEPHGC